MRQQFRYAFLILCLFGQLAAAQTVMISDPLSIRNDYGYELIGRLRDRILLFRDKYEEFEVQAFDAQMRMSWSKKLEDLEKRDLQILAVVPGRNDFSVIFKTKVRNRIQLRVHKYDPGANLIDSMMMKDYGERFFSPPLLNYVRSDDRNCFVVYNRTEASTLEATCFHIDKMTVLWDEVLALREEFDFVNVRGLVVGNQGEFFIFSEMNNRKSRLNEHSMYLTEMGRSNRNQSATISLPESYTRDVKFMYDNGQHRVVGAGLFGEKNRERIHGAFYVSYDPATSKQVLNYETFDDQFLSILRRRDTDDDTKGVTDASVQHLIPRMDGGLVLICERFHEIQRGATTGRGIWRDGMNMIVDYYYDDLFLIAFQPDGKSDWKTVLHKKQYSQDDDGIFSSYYLFQRPDRLSFLFNDEIRYENTCSEYVVSPMGEFDRNSVLNTVGQGMRLRFRDALQLNTEECLIPSEFRNKLRLVLLRYGGAQ
jgi:hypothetical protein